MTVLNVQFGSVTEIDSYDGLSTKWPAAAVQTRAVYPDGTFVRAWRCSTKMMSDADMVSLKAIVSETVGGAGIFQWTPPGGSQIDVQMENPRLAWQNRSKRKSIVEIVIVSVRPG